MTRKRYSDGNCLKILRQVESDLDEYCKICEFLQVEGVERQRALGQALFKTNMRQVPRDPGVGRIQRVHGFQIVSGCRRSKAALDNSARRDKKSVPMWL